MPPFYTPDQSRLYYDMACVVHPSSVNIWLSTRVTTSWINFNFTDIIHLVCPIHGTGNGPCSSLNMYILTQLLVLAFCYYSSSVPNSWYWQWALQLIKYVHTDPITYFSILVIPEAIFEVRAFKFGTVGALNRLININSGFYDCLKIIFLAII